jgi:hypothetical protein
MAQMDGAIDVPLKLILIKSKKLTRFRWYSETRIPKVGIASNRRL